MPVITLARQAMATRFEVVLQGDDAIHLRAAGEEALDEISRLEQQLSLYQPSSDISRINALAAREPVRVEPRLFQLLERALALGRATDGAFDITVAPLVRCWGFMGGTGRVPDDAALQRARACVGLNLIELNASDSSVRFLRPGVMVDLGSIGKGYALECAAELLRDAGIARALLHGGTSTVVALGRPEDQPHWSVAVDSGPAPAAASGSTYPSDAPTSPPLAIVTLQDEALSVSAVWGKSFSRDGRAYGHILDPRTGQPVQHAVLAATILPSATEADALSTAILIGGPTSLGFYAARWPQLRALVASSTGPTEPTPSVVTLGIDPCRAD
jgi:FAD:protein FMN transferase